MSELVLLEKYFPTLDNNTKEQFEKLGKLYEIWNSKINLISRKDIEHLYLRHILYSLSIAKLIKFKPNTKILDVGTGGGFPGIPLCIYFPEVKFVLIDSIAKKIKVVNEVSQALGLKNCKAYQVRAEKVETQFDFVVSRSVKPLPIIYNWINNKIIKVNNNKLANGILYLKGGNFTDELIKLKTRYQLYDIKDFFHEDFFETKKIVHIYT